MKSIEDEAVESMTNEEIIADIIHLSGRPASLKLKLAIKTALEKALDHITKEINEMKGRIQ